MLACRIVLRCGTRWWRRSLSQAEGRFNVKPLSNCSSSSSSLLSSFPSTFCSCSHNEADAFVSKPTSKLKAESFQTSDTFPPTPDTHHAPADTQTTHQLQDPSQLTSSTTTTTTTTSSKPQQQQQAETNSIDAQSAPPTPKKKRRKKATTTAAMEAPEMELPPIPLIPVQVKSRRKKKASAAIKPEGDEKLVADAINTDSGETLSYEHVKVAVRAAIEREQAKKAAEAADQTTGSTKVNTTQAVSKIVSASTSTSTSTTSQTEKAAPALSKRKWTPREWVIFIGQQKAQWKAQRKGSPPVSPASATDSDADAKNKDKVIAPIKLKAPSFALPPDLEVLEIDPANDETRRARDLKKFVSMVSWIQFRNFLVSFHKGNWQIDVLTIEKRYKNYLLKCCKIFNSNEVREIVETISPHLHKLTPEMLYEARRESRESIPLLGEVPYLAAFVPDPVSCPCVRPPVSGEPKFDQSAVQQPAVPLLSCQCYPPSKLEIYVDNSNEVVKQRISALTKNGTKVFVENLHPEIGVKELMGMFCKIGQVQAVEIFRERLTGEGAETLSSILATTEEAKPVQKKRPPLQRQVTGQSPVYAFVYFLNKRGEQRALHPVIRLLGVNFLKHEARTHPADEKKILNLGNLPLIPVGGLETYIVSLLTDGQYKSNAKLVNLLNPPPQYHYKKDTLIKESARYGFCLAEFADHASALLAYQKLVGLSLPKDGSYPANASENCRPLRVGWQTSDPSMRHEAAKHESTKTLRARKGQVLQPVKSGDPFAAAQAGSFAVDRLVAKDEFKGLNGYLFSSEEKRINGHHSSHNGHNFNEFLGNGQILRCSLMLLFTTKSQFSRHLNSSQGSAWPGTLKLVVMPLCGFPSLVWHGAVSSQAKSSSGSWPHLQLSIRI